jgi:hypothetical protein
VAVARFSVCLQVNRRHPQNPTVRPTNEIMDAQTTSDIDQQFADAHRTFDDGIQSHQLMCRIYTAYAGDGDEHHNCLGCNFNGLTEQISSYLRIITEQDSLFTLSHACELYFLQLNALWERITDVFDIIGVPPAYRVRHYGDFIKARRWANFNKHPKEFGWLVHHPEFTLDGSTHHADLVANSCDYLYVNDEFVKRFYACDRPKGLAKEFETHQTTVVVVYPNLASLTSGIVTSLANFVSAVTDNPVYFEMLNDKATIKDFYRNQCE